jgi:hypothetical protein
MCFIHYGWKKINVEQRDKSHVGPQRKKKQLVDLIKMVKKNVGPQRDQKNKKRNELLHCTIFTPLVNINSGCTKKPKKTKEDKKFVPLVHKLLFKADKTILIYYIGFLFWALVNTMHNKYPQ